MGRNGGEEREVGSGCPPHKGRDARRPRKAHGAESPWTRSPLVPRGGPAPVAPDGRA